MTSTFPRFLRHSHLWIAILLFTASILGRVLYRGVYFPGWDILGAAQGQYLIKTQGILGAAKHIFYDSRHYQYWAPISSWIYTLVPGGLNIIHPWELWTSLLTFILFLLILRLMFFIPKLGKQDFPLFLFSITGCSAFLSFGVVGYPFITGVLPHALAWLLIYHPKIRSRPLATFILGCLIAELSMHCYELGRTALLVFLFNAIFDKKADKKLKLAWIGSSSLFLFYIFYYRISVSHQTVFDYKNIFGVLPVLELTLTQAKYDSPLLFILGLVSCFFVKRERFPLILNLFIQWFLIFVLFKSFGPENVRSRRFLVLEFYSLLLFLCAWKDSSNKTHLNSELTNMGKFVLTLVFLGACWQIINLYNFIRVDITLRNRSLPFTESLADYFTKPKVPQTLSAIERQVNSGKRLLLLYNYFSYTENTTDPDGLPERLYIRLGHQKFSEQILIFSDLKKRYSQVPIRDPKDLAEIIPSLKKENSFKNIEIWKLKNEINSKSQTKILSQMALLQSHFNLTKCSEEVLDWDCFKVASLK